MAQCARRYQESLHDEQIINDLYSDNLLDMPDIFSEGETASGSDKEGVNVLTECGSGSEGSDSDDTAWAKVGHNAYIRTVHRKSKGETKICHTQLMYLKQYLFFWR
jgi:hypothetical protein